ncbi:hypothetical protein EV1_019614 [Malus domestica]
MPIHLDKPFNARLLEELGVGVEVKKTGGSLRREEVAKAIKDVCTKSKTLLIKACCRISTSKQAKKTKQTACQTRKQLEYDSDKVPVMPWVEIGSRTVRTKSGSCFV